MAGKKAKAAPVAPEAGIAVAEPKRPMTEHEAAVAESRKVLAHTLPTGQAFFEAPDGYIIVGEKDRPFVLDPRNHAHQIRINPMR